MYELLEASDVDEVAAKERGFSLEQGILLLN
jgi:hypothetical protein